jgi:hypothetical protein
MCGEAGKPRILEQVLQSGPSRADVLCSYRLSLLLEVRSSRIFK